MKKTLTGVFFVLSFLCAILSTGGCSDSSSEISYDKCSFLDLQKPYDAIAQMCLSIFDETANGNTIDTYYFSKDMKSLLCLTNDSILSLQEEQVQAATIVNQLFRLEPVDTK